VPDDLHRDPDAIGYQEVVDPWEFLVEADVDDALANAHDLSFKRRIVGSHIEHHLLPKRMQVGVVKGRRAPARAAHG
jgi:hypothetical protein